MHLQTCSNLFIYKYCGAMHLHYSTNDTFPYAAYLRTKVSVFFAYGHFQLTVLHPLVQRTNIFVAYCINVFFKGAAHRDIFHLVQPPIYFALRFAVSKSYLLPEAIY